MYRWLASLMGSLLLPTVAQGQTVDSAAIAVAAFRTAAVHGQLTAHAGEVPRVVCLAYFVRRPSGDTRSPYVAPDSTIVARVSADVPTAVSLADCTIEPRRSPRDHTSLVVHPLTGRRGIVVWIQSPARDSTGALKVDIGYFEHGLSAGWWTCAVQRIDSAWVVNACQLLGIS